MESAEGLFNLANNENIQEQAASPSGRIASFLSHVLTGAVAGAKEGRAGAIVARNQAIENQSKIVETQKKLQEMKNEAENQRISTNFAKKFGFMDLDPNEKDAARGAAFDHVTAKNPAPDPTSAGAIATLMIGHDEYDPVPSFSPKSGMSINFQKSTTKKDASAAAADKAARIKDKAYQLAVDAARRDKFNQVSTLSSDPNEITKFAQIQPTEDEIQKYVPEMVSYLQNDSAGSEKSRRRRTDEMKVSDVALKEMQSQVEDLRSRSGLRNAFTPGDQAAELSSITERRNALLNGGGLPVVRAHYGEEIKKLTAKRAAGKADAEDTARLKELTRRLLQIGDIGGQK